MKEIFQNANLSKWVSFFVKQNFQTRIIIKLILNVCFLAFSSFTSFLCGADWQRVDLSLSQQTCKYKIFFVFMIHVVSMHEISWYNNVCIAYLIDIPLISREHKSTLYFPGMHVPSIESLTERLKRCKRWTGRGTRKGSHQIVTGLGRPWQALVRTLACLWTSGAQQAHPKRPITDTSKDLEST